MAGVFNLDDRWKSISTMNDSSVTQLFNGFESIFNEASVYSLIAKGNTSGSEGALIMFKHNTSSASFGFACSRGFGSIAVRRNTDGNWYYKRIGY